jgi:hypothetical protein
MLSKCGEKKTFAAFTDYRHLGSCVGLHVLNASERKETVLNGLPFGSLDVITMFYLVFVSVLLFV